MSLRIAPTPGIGRRPERVLKLELLADPDAVTVEYLGVGRESSLFSEAGLVNPSEPGVTPELSLNEGPVLSDSSLAS